MHSKIVLITGSSRGLGRNAALHVARAGHDVIVTYLNNATEAQKVVEEIKSLDRKAIALKLDVGQSKTFSEFSTQLKQALKDQWNKSSFDVLVNNAGFGIYKPFAETTEEDFDQLMNVHFKGTFFLTQKLLPLLSDGGKVLNLSSGLARFSLPGYSAYASMKGAIEVLTRYMSKELGARKISVNTIAPGAIETDFGGGMVRDSKELNAMIASQTALGRVGLPDDIGKVIATFVSDQTDWINGQRIEISGGIHL